MVSYSKGEKMALKIFIDIGGNMRWHLAASQVSFGLQCLTRQGQWELHIG